MPIEASQIRSWLRLARERAGLTQEGAARRADVLLGVVQNAEQKGSMRAENFLMLVVAYGAEKELVNQLRDWRNAPRQDDGKNGVVIDPAEGATTQPKRPAVRVPAHVAVHPKDRAKSAGGGDATGKGGKSRRRAAGD